MVEIREREGNRAALLMQALSDSVVPQPALLFAAAKSAAAIQETVGYARCGKGITKARKLGAWRPLSMTLLYGIVRECLG